VAPAADGRADAELFLFRVDAHLHARRLLLVQHDHRRHFALHLVERAQEHLARVDARGVDVLAADLLQRLVDGNELREIVVTLRRRSDGMGRTQPLPQTTGSETRREVLRQDGKSRHHCNAGGAFIKLHRLSISDTRARRQPSQRTASASGRPRGGAGS
jgi:hypothetical protein